MSHPLDVVTNDETVQRVPTLMSSVAGHQQPFRGMP
jgi:hypothetical protein